MRRILALIVVALAGCSGQSPQATGNIANRDSSLPWTANDKLANAEFSRLAAEENEILAAGLHEIYDPAINTWTQLYLKYHNRRNLDGQAAIQFIGKVQGKHLSDFDPQPEQTADRYLEWAKTLEDQSVQKGHYERIAKDFPSTMAGAKARELAGALQG